MRIYQKRGRYFIKAEDDSFFCDFWCYPSVRRPECSRLIHPGRISDNFGPPPSETLRTLIEANAPWYVVLDRFVEEYPQWEEVMTWAPTANSEVA